MALNYYGPGEKDMTPSNRARLEEIKKNITNNPIYYRLEYIEVESDIFNFLVTQLEASWKREESAESVIDTLVKQVEKYKKISAIAKDALVLISRDSTSAHLSDETASEALKKMDGVE